MWGGEEGEGGIQSQKQGDRQSGKIVIKHRDADFPLFSVFSVILGPILSPPIRFPFSFFSIFSSFIFLFLNFLSLFVFIFCETAHTCRFSVIFAKVQWHPCKTTAVKYPCQRCRGIPS